MNWVRNFLGGQARGLFNAVVNSIFQPRAAAIRARWVPVHISQLGE